MHFLGTTTADLVANVNQFQTRHFETLAKVIDRAASIEMRRRKSEHSIKGNIQRAREKKRQRERETKRGNLDRSYKRYAFREVTVHPREFVARAIIAKEVRNKRIKQTIDKNN